MATSRSSSGRPGPGGRRAPGSQGGQKPRTGQGGTSFQGGKGAPGRGPAKAGAGKAGAGKGTAKGGAAKGGAARGGSSTGTGQDRGPRPFASSEKSARRMPATPYRLPHRKRRPKNPPVDRLDQHDPDGVRLQKLMAQAGVASRRVCEEMIEAGRVQVNGETITELGIRVDPDTVEIHVDASREVSTNDWISDAPVVMPVGIAEWGIDGIAEPIPPGPFDSGCRSDLVAVDGLPATVEIDRSRGTATVAAGLPYGEVAVRLHEQGYALPNLASLPHISVAGAVAGTSYELVVIGTRADDVPREVIRTGRGGSHLV